jgi:hypothetical protein
MKNNYANALLTRERTKKKQTQEFLLSFFPNGYYRKLIGLAGPHIEDYIVRMEAKGFQEFTIYEKDGLTAINQLASIKKPIVLKMEDVLSADANEEDTFYDLDFCGTVRYLKEHIAKFKNRFIMTFCCRVSITETLDTFFSVRGENILSASSETFPIKHQLFETNMGKYVFVNYKDGTQMCSIAKIS